ncbi:putative MFS transporter [Viridothelium virens]|uniref:Putative MFS transporter n=1 Tax=Viridothelium virens TaxID=1048519 RepID=A0A6A6H4F5_VIRVR|nr:putative MFS transporter [Viridothelium virens]
MLRFPFTANRWQVLTYLFGVALFSISFLVFLTSSVSWVITDLLGRRSRVGDAVGTLGFADELVALVACPAWGIISDRVGVRTVAVIGYTIVGLSLFLFVQAKNLYPQLLLARLFFSLGGAATSTMVTAILPTMTHPNSDQRCGSTHRVGPFGSNHIVAPSISSELTITPARFRSSSPASQTHRSTATRKIPSSSNSQLAGLVGMFTGLGALLALGFFLPLPTRFQNGGASRAESVAKSYYVVGTIAFLVAFVCLFGLRNLPGEDEKGLRATFRSYRRRSVENEMEPSSQATRTKSVPYHRLLLSALSLGIQDVDIGLGYLGGFVARASSVGISTFIPLATNAYFLSIGACDDEPTDLNSSDLSDIKDSCRRAYILAATLTGTSQLVALISAPLFGYFSGRYPRFNIPLLTSAAAGVIGYTAFATLSSLDPRSEAGSSAVYFFVALMGVSQIGAIVCSLGLLARGIQKESGFQQHFHEVSFSGSTVSRVSREPSTDGNYDESAPLLSSHSSPTSTNPSRSILKGSIAGVYSFAGGAGILLLTKLGGALFDETGHGAPFVTMAIFNSILFIVASICTLWIAVRGNRAGVDLVKEDEGHLNGEIPSDNGRATEQEVS